MTAHLQALCPVLAGLLLLDHVSLDLAASVVLGFGPGQGHRLLCDLLHIELAWGTSLNYGATARVIRKSFTTAVLNYQLNNE